MFNSLSEMRNKQRNRDMKMRGSVQKNLLMVMMVLTVAAAARGEGGFVIWGDNYYTTWGHPALVINETSELQLTLDHKSGFCLFLSLFGCVFCLYMCYELVFVSIRCLCFVSHSLTGSGFESYKIYGSGSFNMRIKSPKTKSTKVTTSFYVSVNDGEIYVRTLRGS